MSYSTTLGPMGQADWFFNTTPSTAAQAMEPNQPVAVPANASEAPAQLPAAQVVEEALTSQGQTVKYAVIAIGGMLALLVVLKILRGKKRAASAAPAKTPQIIVIPASARKRKRRKGK